MPPKKKANKQGEDDTTLSIMKYYRRACEMNGIINQNKAFKDKVEAACDEGEALEKVLNFNFFIKKNRKHP